MTRPEQKKEESEIVNRLRSVLPDFPAGDLECLEKNEKPDCLVRRPDGKCLGIEVTKLVAHGLRVEPYQKLTEDIAAAANQAYASLGGVWPYAHIYFADSFRCGREQIARFGEQIANAVYPFIQRSTSSSLITVDRSNAVLPNGVEQLHVYRFPEPLQPQFCVATRGPWKWLNRQHIQEILDDKTERFPYTGKSAARFGFSSTSIERGDMRGYRFRMTSGRSPSPRISIASCSLTVV